jgi:phospholipase C
MRKTTGNKLALALIGVTVSALTAVLVLGVSPADPAPVGISKIKHVIMIVQQNRTFDNYFGTYPGANGIPMKNGIPTVCIPNPASGKCVRPSRDPADLNVGGPHGNSSAVADIAGGKMDGFVAQAHPAKCLKNPRLPSCAPGTSAPDVIGYHDYHEIPNYWAYAKNFVLQDRMFTSSLSWGGPTGSLFMVSGWSARCKIRGNPMSCSSAVQKNPQSPDNLSGKTPNYAWTDLTYLLHRAGVSWGFYFFTGTQADCNDHLPTCTPGAQNAKTPARWNPLPYFSTVRKNGQEANVQSISKFYEAAAAGTLPAVSWVVPDITLSERNPGVVSAGESYVTGLVNAVMSGPDWKSTAIFVTWDDWGGYYDHVSPPRVDENGYGLRVPGLVISPYAKRGYVDHQTLSFDAYLKFIEDAFLGGRRLDPKTDGRPDSRPVVRERVAILGDLRRDFDFSQKPRKPSLLPLNPTLLDYSAVWNGKQVSLISTPQVEPGRVSDAKRIGQASSFQSNDSAYQCLEGATLRAWSLPAEFPGRIVISRRGTPGCRAGTWVLPRTSLG